MFHKACACTSPHAELEARHVVSARALHRQCHLLFLMCLCLNANSSVVFILGLLFVCCFFVSFFFLGGGEGGAWHRLKKTDFSSVRPFSDLRFVQALGESEEVCNPCRISAPTNAPGISLTSKEHFTRSSTQAFVFYGS